MFQWEDSFHGLYWISVSRFTGHLLVEVQDDFGTLQPTYANGLLLYFGMQEH